MSEQDRVTESEWTTVAQFATRAEGDVAVSALSAADVPCKLVVEDARGDGPHGIDPNLGPEAAGVELRVPEDRVGEATALLTDQR